MFRASLDALNMILREFWTTLSQRGTSGGGWDDEEGLGYGVRALIQVSRNSRDGDSQLQHSMECWGLCQRTSIPRLCCSKVLWTKRILEGARMEILGSCSLMSSQSSAKLILHILAGKT